MNEEVNDIFLNVFRRSLQNQENSINFCEIIVNAAFCLLRTAQKRVNLIELKRNAAKKRLLNLVVQNLLRYSRELTFQSFGPPLVKRKAMSADPLPSEAAPSLPPSSKRPRLEPTEPQMLANFGGFGNFGTSNLVLNLPTSGGLVLGWLVGW